MTLKVQSNQPTTRRSVLLEKLKVKQLVNKFPFMDSEGSLFCSQEPITDPCPQMYPVHNFPPYFPKMYSNVIFPSMPKTSKWLLPSGFPTKILYAFLIISPMRPAHLIFIDLITLVMFGEA